MDTIEEFANLAGTTEKLDYLYLLTVNDIRATNPALWNGWKHGLLKDLFILTRSKINKEPVQTIKEITEDRKKNCIRSFKEEKEKAELYKKLNEEQEKDLLLLKTEVDRKQGVVNEKLKKVEEDRKVNFEQDELNRQLKKHNAAYKAKLKFIEEKYDYSSAADKL